MSFTDHKITQFAHRVSDLPDEPQIPAAELKSRFDACPEELRQSLNAVCDDAERLEARVEGIVAETFGDTIPKSMLSNELQDELDAKAVAATVAEQLAAEAAAREATDDALDTRLTANETLTAQKCEAYIGYYQGDGEASQTINLPFTPQGVFVVSRNGYNRAGLGLATAQSPAGGEVPQHRYSVIISGNGFIVYNHTAYDVPVLMNTSNEYYHFIALR